MSERDRRDDAEQPDPTADAWSAWLPRLDPPTTPLPQASAPPDSAIPPAPSASTPSPPPASTPAPTPAPPPVPQPTSPIPPSSWYAASPPPGPMPPPPAVQLYTAPPSRLALAIICTIFCFTPFGIVAIVKATTVGPKWAQGRFDEARRTSASVKNWCILAALAWPGSAIFFACTGLLGSR